MSIYKPNILHPRVPDMKVVVENVVETIATLNTKEESIQDEINDRYTMARRQGGRYCTGEGAWKVQGKVL
jgi:hypothetical protein